MSIEVLLLLLVFQIKHLVADYYLQFPYMYENKGKKENWIMPLLEHSLVHGILTLLVVLVFSSSLVISIGVSLLDVFSHFIIDRVKATRKSTIEQSQFWVNLGLDQMAHHIIGIIVIYIITQGGV